jgi:hypothetical protein
MGHRYGLLPKLILAIVIVAAGLFVVGTPAIAVTGRVALVIGNGAYQKVPTLPNPPNDANDVAGSLERLGFAVTKVVNARYEDMRRALIDFSRQTPGAEMAVVFYAGHGMEIGGENWLIPVDAELRNDTDAENEAINLRGVMLQVSHANALGLVILDACRNNPYAANMHRSIRSRAVERGLARTEPADNVLVAYSAKDGTTANDGAGRNSPFTAALLKNIETPGLEITFMFRSVRDDVMAATQHEQQPFVYGSLSKAAIFLKAVPPVAAAPGPDELAWTLIRETDDPGALNRFVTQFAGSALRPQAEARIAALAAAAAARPVPPPADQLAWDFVKDTEDPAQLRHFVERFPSSTMRAEAQMRIAALNVEAVAKAKANADAAKKLQAAAKPEPPPAPAPDETGWSLVKETKDLALLGRFIEQFPASPRRSDAEVRIATLQRDAETLKPALSPPVDRKEIARSVQLELKRLGCFDGAVNGEFNASTKTALRNFANLVAVSVGENDPTIETLKTIRGFDKRICPLVCGPNERVDGDRCIRVVCPSGQLLKDGSCVGEPEAAPKRRASKPSESEPAPPSRKRISPRLEKPSARSKSTATADSYNPSDQSRRITPGGLTTCGQNGCERVPVGCHAVRGVPGGHGMGGKIFCP